jgi:hypothetical protein
VSHHANGAIGLQALPGQANDQGLPLRRVEFDVCSQVALWPHEAPLVSPTGVMEPLRDRHIGASPR